MNMKDDVNKALDSIRPYLQADNGDVELVDITVDGIVKVRLTGACDVCPANVNSVIVETPIVETKLYTPSTDVVFATTNCATGEYPEPDFNVIADNEPAPTLIV